MSDHVSQLVRIEKPVYSGSFLARAEGKALFVPLALPGEQVRVHVVEDKRGYATAEIDELVEAAPQRIEPRCPHFGACGGCDYQHTDSATQLHLKREILRETLERGGVRTPGEISVLTAEPWGYRNRIRLTFDAKGNPGYRGRRSHAVVPIAECPIAAPVLVEAALAFVAVLHANVGSLRLSELALFCNGEETELLATITFARHPKLDADKLAEAWTDRIPALTGIEFAVEGRSGQPARTVARWGATSLTYRAAGFDYRVDHGAFFQVNRWLIDSLVERVTGSHSGKLAWDLFAGVGLFARKLTASFERVIAVESAPSSTQALTTNLKFMRSTPVRATTLDFLRRDHAEERPDLVVVDPPRSGLGAAVTQKLIEISPPAVVYVSCDPATLARDLHMLTGAGYTLSSVTLADLFPQTFHLETVVELRRA
jgi:23S rRNA (uracil1939-C5)-methyltransferase